MLDPEQIKAGTNIPQSAALPEQVWLTRLVPRTLLHTGLFLAVVMAFLVYIFLWRTTIGYRIRAVGLNPSAARYAGIPVKSYMALAMTLSGAFAGLAGTNNVYGVNYRMITDGSASGFTGGAGFNGIVVALFGQLHPLWSIPASVLFGGLLVGANSMQRAVQVPSAFVTVLNGLVVIFVVSSEIWRRRRQKRRLAAAHEDEHAPPPADKEKIQAEVTP
jgi:simple sugar transport system permease protein